MVVHFLLHARTRAWEIRVKIAYVDFDNFSSINVNMSLLNFSDKSLLVASISENMVVY